MPEQRPMTAEDVRRASWAGVKWVSLGRLVAESTALLASLVLARLLTPAEFGHAVIANLVFVLAAGLPVIGFAGVLVQREEVSEALIRSAVGLSVIAGVGLSLAIAVIALAARPLIGEEAGDLAAVTAPCVAIAALGSVAFGLLQRRLDFRATTLAEVGGGLVATAVTIAAAVAGLGALSLVAGYVAGTTALAVIAVAIARPPRPRWNLDDMRDVLTFGLPATGAFALTTLVGYADYAVLSVRASASQVGLYWRGFQLAVDYQGKVSNILMRLAFPVLSRAPDPADVRRLRARMVRAHTTLLFPGLALLAALAPLVVPFLYGEAWEDAVVPTQILTIAGALTVLNKGTGPIMLALGRPKPLMWACVAELSVMVPAVLLAAPYGLAAVCWAAIAGRLTMAFVLQYLLLDRMVGIPIKESLRNDVVPALAGSAALLAVAFPLGVLGQHGTLPGVVAVATATALGLTAYSVTLRQWFPEAYEDFATVARKVRRRRGQAPAG